jgi:hypothetical protein
MSSATSLTRKREVYDKIFIHYSPYDWLIAHALVGRHGGREDTHVDKLAWLTKSNNELMEKNTQLDK